MAQSTLAEIKPAKSPLLESHIISDMLLQKHRSLLVRFTVIRMTGRLLNFTVLVILTASPFSAARSVALALASIFISACWFVERRHVTAETGAIEKTLAKHSGDQFEDLFIQAKFKPHEVFAALNPFLINEHFFWSMLICLFAFAHYFVK